LKALRAEVLSLLVRDGYVELPPRINLGSIELDVPDLWESPPENMDLSLVVDKPGSREFVLRLYWLVQRLTRALDSAGSRRTVTVILLSEPSPTTDLGDLLEFARVLIVDGSLPTERMIGPLLRLRLPATATSQLDGITEVMSAIRKDQSAHELVRLINAASGGANLVSDRYRAWLDEAFAMRGKDND
jgi:hypothetical protein